MYVIRTLFYKLSETGLYDNIAVVDNMYIYRRSIIAYYRLIRGSTFSVFWAMPPKMCYRQILPKNYRAIAIFRSSPS